MSNKKLKISQLNYISCLQQRSLEKPSAIAYRIVDSQGATKREITYFELNEKARCLAQLLSQTAAPGDRAILVYDTDTHFIIALFACLYAGIIAVPAYPPTQIQNRVNVAAYRLKNIILDSEPTLLLTTQKFLQFLPEENGQFKKLATDQMNLTGNAPDLIPKYSEIALLQYTSGSTSNPKGVMITHENIFNNVSNILNLEKPGFLQSVVSWLPLTHDMGIVAGIFLPLFNGIPSVLLSPLDFLRRPIIWLELISKLPDVISGGPNFAYELCHQRVNEVQLRTLNLSHWRVAFAGSEMNHVKTYQQFLQKFSACGFDEKAFYPCYGLAESTVYATGGVVNAPVIIDQSLLSVGHCFKDHELLIVNPNSRQVLSEGTVGEIWLKGPSVAKGYWKNKVLTESVFDAYTHEGKGPYLRTGDLGFIRKGELFFYGRLKDIIIIRGKTYPPEDIEWAVVQSDENIRTASVAAFSILQDDQEKLIIVAEVKGSKTENEWRSIFENIRECVSKNFAIKIHEIVCIRAKTLPKTVNGKIQRQICRSAYLDNQLAQLACCDRLDRIEIKNLGRK